jgi:hypothetical protein
MATKKIPELDPYGSVNSPAYLSDLLEISKNTGTYGSPSYDTGSSRKITFEQVISNLGYIPYSGQNYEIVKNTGSDTQNGTNLKTALAACYSKTPNGAALSANNRAVLYLLAGTYNLGSDSIAIGLYVDIKSLSSKESVIITSSNATGTIVVGISNNYSLSGFKISNSASGKSISITSSIDDGVWRDLILDSGTTDNKNYNGSYGYLICTGNCFGGNISGHIFNCSGAIGNNPTGTMLISGLIENCTSSGAGFGSSLAGTINISGVIRNCKASANSFGYTQAPNTYQVIISGLIENCESNGTFSFGSAVNSGIQVTVSGIIRNCKSKGFSFGYSSPGFNSVSGLIENCTVVATGTDRLNAYGSTTSTGVIKNCKGYNSHGTHLGLVENCYFLNEEGSFVDVLKIGESGRIKYTTAIQMESTQDSIKVDSGASVNISHCETNQDFNLVSAAPYTNLINTAYNVIDVNLTK